MNGLGSVDPSPFRFAFQNSEQFITIRLQRGQTTLHWIAEHAAPQAGQTT
jgi:hypothetical protein